MTSGMLTFLNACFHRISGLGDALGARGPDVVLREHGQHARAHESHHDRRQVEPETHRGQDEAPEARAPGHRHQPRPDGEHEDQEDAEPERRDGLADHGDRRRQVIDPAPGAIGGQDAERHGEGHAHQETCHRELDGRGRPLEQDREGLVPDDERIAELAAHRAPEEPRVLEEERVVEPQAPPEVRHRLLGGLRRQEHLGGITGQVKEHEHHERDRDAGQGRVDEPLDDVGTHGGWTPAAALPGGRRPERGDPRRQFFQVARQSAMVSSDAAL